VNTLRAHASGKAEGQQSKGPAQARRQQSSQMADSCKQQVSVVRMGRARCAVRQPCHKPLPSGLPKEAPSAHLSGVQEDGHGNRGPRCQRQCGPEHRFVHLRCEPRRGAGPAVKCRHSCARVLRHRQDNREERKHPSRAPLHLQGRALLGRRVCGQSATSDTWQPHASNTTTHTPS